MAIQRKLITRPERLSANGKLFLAIIVILLLEGAIKKWIFSGAGSPLIGLRDLLALILIFRALSAGYLTRNKLPFNLLLFWSLLVLAWGLLQLMLNQTPITIYVLGVRFWLVYLWLAYAASCTLTEADSLYIIRFFMIAGIAMTPLVILQHYLPPGHFLNVQPDTEENRIFVVSGNIVRTSGTFTFVLGYACFLAVFTALTFSNSWNGQPIWKSRIMPTLCVICSVAGTVVSGSRGCILFLFAILFIYIASGLLYIKGGAIKRSYKAKIAVLMIAVMGSLFFLDRAITATEDRFHNASQSENTGDRITWLFLGEPKVAKQFTMLGAGLGAGTNAGASLVYDKRGFTLAETEPGRVLLEMGVVGVAWTLLKWLIVFTGLIIAFNRHGSSKDNTSTVLWSATGYAILTWPISGQIAAQAFAYILLTFAILSSKADLSRSPRRITTNFKSRYLARA